jgi:hypothetical protein
MDRATASPAPRNPRRTLVSDREIARVFAKLRDLGVDPAGCAIDIRTDGITISPPAPSPAPGNAYDAYRAEKDARSDRPARR